MIPRAPLAARRAVEIALNHSLRLKYRRRTTRNRFEYFRKSRRTGLVRVGLPLPPRAIAAGPRENGNTVRSLH